MVTISRKRTENTYNSAMKRKKIINFITFVTNIARHKKRLFIGYHTKSNFIQKLYDNL